MATSDTQSVIDYIVDTGKLQDNFFTQYIKNSLPQVLIVNGGFGAGKTTFIKKIAVDNPAIKTTIKKTEIASAIDSEVEKYLFFYLSPVKYHTGGNDVFTIMKHDILFQALEMKLIEEIFDNKTKLEHDDDARVKEEVNKFLAALAELRGARASAFLKVVSSIITLLKEYKLHTEQDATDIETKKSLEYLNQKIDYLDKPSELISFILAKAKSKNYKTLLIIDDLDRLDPDQTFKTLNQLTVFLDNEFDNPYGNLFDKVVLLCDVENLKHSYHHKYGDKSNFSGYFFKYHRNNIYNFDISHEIADRLSRDLLNYEGNIGSLSRLYREYMNPERGQNQTFIYLFTTFIRNQLLSIRDIKNVNNWAQRLQKQTVSTDGNRKIILDAELLLSLMISFFPGRKEFIENLNKARPYLLEDTSDDNGNLFELFLSYIYKEKKDTLSYRTKSVSFEAGAYRYSLEINTDGEKSMKNLIGWSEVSITSEVRVGREATGSSTRGGITISKELSSGSSQSFTIKNKILDQLADFLL